MIRLLFIVPYPELREKVEHVISHHPEKKRLNADIRVMTVEDTPDFPADEYDAIIARGYTAQKTVAKYKQVPTIGLSISGYDMVRAISECCEMYHPKKVAVLGFGGQMYEVKNICRFFKIDVEVHAPVRHEELPAKLRKFFEEGKLTTEAIQAIMSEEKPNQREKIVLRGDRVRQLIPKNIPISQTEDFVCKALEHYNKFLRSRADRDSR